MKLDADNNSVSGVNPWVKAAVWTAVAAGVFSVIVAGFLGHSWYDVEIADANSALRLEDMKLQLQVSPKDQNLLSEIRQLDLEIRENRIRWQKFIVSGTYLLLGGAVLFFICLKFAVSFSKKPPYPSPSADIGEFLQRQASWGRRGVLAGLAIVIVVIDVL